jgi:hypothetical protein
VKDVFESRLRATLPLRADKVLRRIRDTRGGKLYDSRFGVRGRGEGAYAEAITSLFDHTAQQLGYDMSEPQPDLPSPFRRPRGQLALF